MATHIMYEIGNSAVRLTPNGSHSGMDITIQNQGPTALYLGVDDTVSEGNYGFKLAVDQAISFELPGFDNLYAYSPNPGTIISTLSIALEQGE